MIFFILKKIMIFPTLIDWDFCSNRAFTCLLKYMLTAWQKISIIVLQSHEHPEISTQYSDYQAARVKRAAKLKK